MLQATVEAMLQATANDGAGVKSSVLDYTRPRWYVVQTRARHEKRVAEQLEAFSCEAFLPLYQEVHQWCDRRVRVELPLFPGYLFVHVSLQDRRQAVCLPGVVRLLAFNGVPAPVPEQEIASLRAAVEEHLAVWPHPYVQAGRRVRIIRGPLCGATGILLRRKNRSHLVLSVDLIQRSVAVEIAAADVSPLWESRP